jgi:hypothetical protein
MRKETVKDASPTDVSGGKSVASGISNLAMFIASFSWSSFVMI